jgi:hypothetical protein
MKSLAARRRDVSGSPDAAAIPSLGKSLLVDLVTGPSLGATMTTTSGPRRSPGC